MATKDKLAKTDETRAIREKWERAAIEMRLARLEIMLRLLEAPSRE